MPLPEIHPDITFILGPTASGKSDLAMALARKHGAAILCLDSMQVYRGADIGTGKPTAAEREEVPHGALDLVEVGEPFDVAAYRDAATGFIVHQQAQGRPVIAVGGTGLYYRALTAGLCEAPAAPQELREEIAALPLADMTRRLEAADPDILPHLDLKNPRRVARALEVVESTGTSLLDWQRNTAPPVIGDHLALFLHREREELLERISQRVGVMLDSGWAKEVRNLIGARGFDAVLGFPAIGYAQLAEWLRNGGDLEEIRQQVVTATRQYAKRQLTWFRRERNLVQITLDEMPNSDSKARQSH